MKESIAVIYGGKSPEHEVSCLSAASIIKELRGAGYDVMPVYISRGGKWLLQETDSSPKETGLKLNPSFTQKAFICSNGEVLQPSVIFPIVHGATGEDGILQGILEMLEIPYVGSGVAASAAGMNKVIAKELVKAESINVLPHVLIKDGDTNIPELINAAAKMGFPLFVKPVSQGSSVGITKVKKQEDLPAAIDKAFRFDTVIMIEKGVDFARELICGVLGNTSTCEASQVGEVAVQGSHEFYDYEAKYLDDNGMKLLIPAPLDNEQSMYVKESSIKVFRALGACGYARVDFFMERHSNGIWFGEINTAPGFTSHSLYPALWKCTGLSVIKVIERLIEIAKIDFNTKKKRSLIR